MSVPAVTSSPNSGVPPSSRRRADDMSAKGWQGLVGGLLEFFAEEAEEPEHVAKDEKVRAAGLILRTPDDSALFLKRSDKDGQDHPGEWCWPGGQLEGDEEPLDAALREAREETSWVDEDKKKPEQVDEGGGDVEFTTFRIDVNNPFIPTLDDEHVGWAWAPLSDPPQPLHPGCKSTLDKIAADSKVTQEEARYTAGPVVDEPCSSCAMFVDAGACTKVEGEISPNGHCRFYQAKTAEDAAEPIYHVTQLGSTWRYYFVAPGKLIPHEMSRPYKSKAEAETAGKSDVEGLKKNLGKDAAANEATKSELKSEIKYPPEKAPGRAINVAMANGGVRGSLKIAPKADKYIQTGLSNDQSIQWFALERAIRSTKDTGLVLAADEANRMFDLDGRMHVKVTNLSKAQVSDYIGNEIPDYQKLGLDPNKVYKLLRDPDELKKAAPTFNGIQLLMRHVPVSAEDHQPWDVVGTTGTDAVFEEPYLKNSLIVWVQRAIDAIESEDMVELSAGYHYRPDPSSGIFEGQHFDLVMRDIIGNHLSLVREGRAGKDVRVGDSLVNLQWHAIERAIIVE